MAERMFKAADNGSNDALNTFSYIASFGTGPPSVRKPSATTTRSSLFS